METLNTKNVPFEKQKKFWGLMIKDAERLNKLINSILEISRLEQKRIAHDYHIYNTDETVRQLIENSVDHFRFPKVALKFEGAAPCKCVIDKEAMQIVFDNLTDNAIKYSIRQDEITIKLSCLRKYTLIEFCDKGIGIEQKDQKKIFYKFLRINNRNIPSVKGTGLGLYWVREIIKMHGGKISVFSEGANKGTSFRIQLPIYKASKRLYINALLKRTAKKQKLSVIENGE